MYLINGCYIRLQDSRLSHLRVWFKRYGNTGSVGKCFSESNKQALRSGQVTTTTIPVALVELDCLSTYGVSLHLFAKIENHTIASIVKVYLIFVYLILDVKSEQGL